ncbi:MAG: hypothetical protein LIO97_11695 [Tannerellaceae bacterium]|nr:hypothetical protein [Tannerellaceae bacterium]
MKKDLDAKKEKDAAEKWGIPYVKIPGSILKRMKNQNQLERRVALIHFLLIANYHYSEQVLVFRKNEYQCKKGEFIGTYQQLSDWSGIPLGSIGRLLRKLEAENMIVVNKISGGCRIRVYGYREYM